MEGRIVKKNAVSLLVVLSETFSVVSHDNDEGIVVPSMLFEMRHKATKRGVRIGNLAIVETVLVAHRIRRWRLIRIVGVIEVDPHEMRPHRMRVPPRFRPQYHFRRTAFQS